MVAVQASLFHTIERKMLLNLTTNQTAEPSLTSGFLREVSRARPGPKPVSDFTLVEVGRGLLHWVKTEKARDLRCWA